jgi:toxin HigB-1
MIKSFRDREAALIWRQEHSRKLPGDIPERALMKLQQLHAAGNLKDLRFPTRTGSSLCRATGRISTASASTGWRICFQWHEGHASEVESADYH